MDNTKNTDGIYSQVELINKGEKLLKNGNRSFIDAKINNKEMSIMLFTSGTTSQSKVVALSHKKYMFKLNGYRKYIRCNYRGYTIINSSNSSCI